MKFTIRQFASALALGAAALLSACGGGTTTDTVAPTLTITDTTSAAKATSAVSFVFTFSEDVGTSFTAADIVVSAGTAGSLTQTSTTTYQMTVTPPSNATGTITVSVAAYKYKDLSNNDNLVAASASQAYDTTTSSSAANTITFSESVLGVNGFGTLVSAAVATDPTDSSNKVLKIVKGAASETWAGATINTTGSSIAAKQTVGTLDFSSSKIITLRVYSPAAGKAILLKAENASDGSQSMEKAVSTTVANSWETLSFDFSSVYSSSIVYSKLSIFPNFNAKESSDAAYYFDDLGITLSSSSSSSSSSNSSLVSLTNGYFASNYAVGASSAWQSSEGGSADRYVADGAADWWNGVAPSDATPNFYFGYGISASSNAWGFGGYVKAPGNGTANVASYSSLQVAVWSNDGLAKTKPTYTVILKGPSVSNCSAELLSTVTVSAIGAQTYTLPLSGFSLKTACSYASVTQALAAGIAEVHIQVLGSNLQYTYDGDGKGFYPNGLNIGPIKFN